MLVPGQHFLSLDFTRLSLPVNDTLEVTDVKLPLPMNRGRDCSRGGMTNGELHIYIYVRFYVGSDITCATVGLLLST